MKAKKTSITAYSMKVMLNKSDTTQQEMEMG